MHEKYICTEHALIYLKSRLFFNLAKLKNAGETQQVRQHPEKEYAGNVSGGPSLQTRCEI